MLKKQTQDVPAETWHALRLRQGEADAHVCPRVDASVKNAGHTREGMPCVRKSARGSCYTSASWVIPFAGHLFCISLAQYFCHHVARPCWLISAMPGLTIRRFRQTATTF